MLEQLHLTSDLLGRRKNALALCGVNLTAIQPSLSHDFTVICDECLREFYRANPHPYTVVTGLPKAKRRPVAA